MPKKIVVAGVCPHCGGKDLAYTQKENNDDMYMTYYFDCKDCYATGYEEYKLEFLGTMVSGGRDVDTYYEVGSEVDAQGETNEKN